MENVTETLRHRKRAAKVIQELDAFPKVPESYQESSTSGGTVSIVTFLFIGILVVSEFLYYRDTEIRYQYQVDKDAEGKIRINVDMTVAMHCNEEGHLRSPTNFFNSLGQVTDIGADVLDLSGTSIDTSNNLLLQPTYFEMTKKQKAWWELFQTIRASQEGYRTINNVLEIMGNDGAKSMPTYMPPSGDTDSRDKDFDGCRIYGNVEVNKVAGNFHITAGKSIPHPRGHAHLSAMVSDDAYNFSHRVDLLSFGEPMPGVINPLDGDLMITNKAYQMYQYYIKIVPTDIKTSKRKIKTNQYSVTQRAREINHLQGSHGVPGIFFKYDLSSLMVQVREERRDFGQFLVRLCGIVGGIFATSGMLHSLIGFLFESIPQSMQKYTPIPKNIGVSQSTSLGAVPAASEPRDQLMMDSLMEDTGVSIVGQTQILTESSSAVIS